MSRIAVINAGSSSIKFAVYQAGSDLPLLLKGQIEGIGAKRRASLSDAQGQTVWQEELPEQGFDHAAAARTMMQITAPRLEGGDISAVGHRVVHGGPAYSAPLLLIDEVIAK